MALKRLNKELVSLVNESPVGYFAEPVSEENLYLWQGCLLGPDDSEYAGGTFYVRILFPGSYPFRPPKVKFETPILHCNINSSGSTNLDILHGQWSPALTVSKLLLSLHSLLTDPNADDPLVPDLAMLYKRDRKAYEQKVKEHTKKFAIIDQRSFSLMKGHRKPSRLYSLMRLCRRVIRDELRYNSPVLINDNIKRLPLPTRMKNFLMFYDGLLGY